MLEWKSLARNFSTPPPTPRARFCGVCFAGSRIKINVHLGCVAAWFLFLFTFLPEGALSQRFFLLRYKQRNHVFPSLS